MKRAFFLTSILAIISNTLTIAQNSWEELNPGAGGQVQDIVCDPNKNGRLFLVSDMEGIYRSTDNGISWEYTSDDLIHHRTFVVTPDPSNSDRVYAGTLAGIHISDNGGVNWNVVSNSIGISIGALAVNPNDSNHIIAATGWRDDYNFGGGIGSHKIKKPLLIFQSRDRGKNWVKTTIDNANTDPNTYSIVFHPNNANIIYLGGAKGIYRSNNKGNTWAKINPPNQIYKFCTGLNLSPNGGHLYATWVRESSKPGETSKIFATKTQDISWKNIQPTGELDKEYPFWYPEVDPRSNGNQHKVIFPILKERPGLFELTIDWDTNTETPRYSWKHIWTRDVRNYDPGWEYSQPGPRVAHYTPKTWSQRAIWSTINQSMLRGIENQNGRFTWQNRYSIRNENFSFPLWGDTQYTYASRGTVSTFTYDIAAHENYVIQGQADNGFMESWDYGISWSNVQGRSKFVYDARAVAIAKVNNTPVVLGQGGSAFGGNVNTASLFIKRLVKLDPSDSWEIIGAGPSSLGNLPYNDLILEISVDPKNKERILISYDTKGIYLINNLSRFIERKENAVKISGNSIQAAREIGFDPDNNNVMYISVIRGDEGLYKVQWNSNENRWNWNKLVSGRGWNAQVKVWKYNGTKRILYTAKNIQGNSDYRAVLVSENGTINTIFDPTKAKQLKSNNWYSSIQDRYKFVIGGVAVYENQLFLSYYDHSWSKGYGLFKGTIKNDNTIQWEDWTANNHFKGGTDAEIFKVKGKNYYYQGTQGVGMWRREIGQENNSGDPILGGSYKLLNQEYNSFLDGDEGGIVDQSFNEGISKEWELIHQADNVYKLKNNKYQQWLYIDENENVMMSDDKVGTARNWILDKVSENIFTLRNQFFKKYLDADNDNTIGLSTSPKLDDQWELKKTNSNRNNPLKEEGDIILFPNPARHTINLITPLDDINKLNTLRIYHINGSLVKTISKNDIIPNINDHIQIDVSEFLDGVYFMECYYDKKRLRSVFIISSSTK